MKIMILFVLCLLNGAVNAQIDINRIDSLKNDVKQQVTKIDNQTLYKTLLDYDGYRTGDESSINEWLTVLYFDALGALKKSKLIYYFTGDEGCYLRYYGKNGVTIYSVYNTFSGMNGGYSVSRYLDKSGELLYIDFLNRDDDRDGQTIEHIIRTGGYGLAMPLINGEVYDKVLNIDSLKNEIKWLFSVDSLYMPKKCIPVKFLNPQKGDKTFVCQNNVPLYPHISNFVEPSCELSSGYRVTILEIKDKWYKVKFRDIEGYISREFLAPVEKIVK